MNSPARAADLLEDRSEELPFAPRHKRIGAILLDTGIVTQADVEQIAIHARVQKRRFGDAAVALGKVSRQAVQGALALQFDHHFVRPGATAISREVVAAFESDHPVLDDLRILRNHILMRWLDAAPLHSRCVAVMSADRGDGRSFVAANLAVTFSQMGQRTLLIDADMRNSRQHLLFGLHNHAGLSSILSQRTAGDAFRRIDGLPDLSVMGCGGTPPNPVDLLARDAFGKVLEGVARTYDVIVVDTPPADRPEAAMIAARARGCVVVAREGATSFSRLRQLSTNLRSAGATVIGSVLSRH